MIPKVIHYCWVGGKPLPELAQKCIASWKQHMPDYAIKEWNEQNYDFTQNEYMRDAYDSKKWGFVPDFARLDIIFNYGGIYLDTDVKAVKSFDGLLNYKGFCGIECGNHVALGLGFGAEPGNTLIKEMRDAYISLQFKNPDGTLNLQPAPKIQTELLLKKGYRMENRLQFVDDCVILPEEYLCPKNYGTGEINITPNTYSIHLYDSSWVSEDEQKFNARRIRYYKKLGKHLSKLVIFADYSLLMIRKGQVKTVIQQVLSKIKRIHAR